MLRCGKGFGHTPGRQAALASTYITFSVFRTQQGSQQTISGRILRMSKLNDTIHSMRFQEKYIWALKGPSFVVKPKSVMSGAVHSM